MNRRRFSNALVAGVCYAIIALLMLGFTGAVTSAMYRGLTGTKRADAVEAVTAVLAIAGAVVAFTIAVWREYHDVEPRDPTEPPS